MSEMVNWSPPGDWWRPTCGSQSPIASLSPVPYTLLFRPGEVWIGSFVAKEQLWAVANAEQRKNHRLTPAQMQRMFESFAVVKEL